jgi:hypothetical protein
MEDQKSLSDHIFKLLIVNRISAKNNSFNKFLNGPGVLASGGGMSRGGGLPPGRGLDNSEFKKRIKSTQISMSSNLYDDADFIKVATNNKDIDSSVIVEYKEAIESKEEPIEPILEEPILEEPVDKKDKSKKSKKSNKPKPAEKDDTPPVYGKPIIYYIS